jgi:hypothetical protein
MGAYKVTVVVKEVSVHEQTIEANSEEEAEALALEDIQENGYPETDDTYTEDLDINAEKI